LNEQYIVKNKWMVEMQKKIIDRRGTSLMDRHIVVLLEGEEKTP
jgi:hypothetical protein